MAVGIDNRKNYVAETIARQNLEDENKYERIKTKRLQKQIRNEDNKNESMTEAEKDAAEAIESEFEGYLVGADYNEHDTNTTHHRTNLYQTHAKAQRDLDEVKKSYERALETSASKYLAPLDFENMADLLEEYYGDKKDVDDLESFLTDIESADEGSELELMNKFIQTRSLNKAQIYMMLQYVMEFLQKRKAKDRFYKQLKKWTMLYEQQESGYLFEFFSLANNKKLQDKFQNFNIDALATLNSTSVVTQTLKNSIEIASKLLEEQFGSLVSLYMGIRAEQLKTLAGENTFESKVKLSELLALEKHLIVLQSMYWEHDKFKKQLLDTKLVHEEIWNQLKQSVILLATINFCESSFVTATAIDKLLSAWNINITNLTVKRRVMQKLLNLIPALPLSLFKDEPKNVQRVSQDIRNILTKSGNDKEADDKNNASSNIEFLKRKSEPIKYV